MQLILDTDTCIDIKEKMTTLEESSEKSYTDDIETLKTAISNGNKENIQCQDNIWKTPEHLINGNDKNDVNEQADTSTPTEDINLEYLRRNNENGEIDEEEKNKTEGQDENTTSNGNELKDQKDIHDTHLNECADKVNAQIQEKVENCTENAEESKDFDVNINEESNLSSLDKDMELEESKINDLLASIDDEVEKDKANDSKNIAEESLSKNNTVMEVEDISKDDLIAKVNDTSKDDTIVKVENKSKDDTIVKVEDKGKDNMKLEDKSKDNPIAKVDDNSKDDTIVKVKDKSKDDKIAKVEDKSKDDTIVKVKDKSKDDKIAKVEDKSKDDTTVKVEDKSKNDTIVKVEDKSKNDTIAEVEDKSKAATIAEVEKEMAVEEEACNKDKGVMVNTTNIIENSVTITESNAEDVDHSDNKNVTDTSVAVSEALEDSTDDFDPIPTPETTNVDQCHETNYVNSAETSNSDSKETLDAKPSAPTLASVPVVVKVDDNVTNDIKVPEIDTSDTVLEVDNNPKLSDNIQSEKPLDYVMECDNLVESNAQILPSVEIKETLDVEELEEINIVKDCTNQHKEEVMKPKKTVCKLSNTLDILSDDEEESSNRESKENVTSCSTEKQCINIEDDDDILLIDDDINSKDNTGKLIQDTDIKAKEEETCVEKTIDLENNTKSIESSKPPEILPETENDIAVPEKEITVSDVEMKEVDTPKAEKTENLITTKPLLPDNFLKAYKKNLADMTRDDLEEFCVLKIVESVVDRSSLCEIKSKLKTMAQNIEEYKKKTMMLSKQNRDLQVVLKSVQEEQKKNNAGHITPLKITRSVGMQVLMTEKPGLRKKAPAGAPNPNSNVNNNINNNNINNRILRTPNQSSQRPQKPPTPSQQIPVPRLVPANNPVAKMPNTVGQSTPVTTQAKTTSPVPNGIKLTPPVQKTAEKRPHSRVQSVTVDLTDDEPPAKITPRSSPAPPVRLVSPQNLLAPRQAFGQTLNSPRKVYIPISGPQSQNVRPGPAIMLKAVTPVGPRQRVPPHVTRMPQSTAVRVGRTQNRHPAPLPDAVKQYQPPNWKTLPPAPDLKLSKVENGIVISWKIEGYQEDSYEEIASYQLYAYQETSSPPSTALWKKIGDVKALPLPMACTLTQFMAGFKYYFAVRAVDIRSRLGPFSLPGSILLLNKM